MAAFGFLLFTLTTARGALTTNSWNTGFGKWEDGANWSAGVPSSDDAVNVIATNLPFGGGVTTVDTATVTQHVINSCMTISNLIVGGTVLSPHTLFLNNANNTPGNIGLTIINSFTISANGALFVTNSNMKVASLGGAMSVDGNGLLNTGTIIVTNVAGGLLSIGRNGQGTFTVSNGTLVGRSVAVADNAGSRGTLTMAGGTSAFRFLSVGLLPTTTGTVWLTGGQLIVSNEATVVGGGVGQMTVSNGTWAASLVLVGSQGTMTIAGGINKFSSLTLAGGASTDTATVWMVGGQLAITNTFNIPGVTNNTTMVGLNGVGQMTISNGTFLARDVYVGTNTGSQGTFTVAGGTNTLTSFLHVGERTAATGAVWMTGGLLIITNNETEVGISGVGQMTMSNGTWLANSVSVGSGPGSQGTLTLAGGTNIITGLFGRLIVGDLSDSTGAVWITDGKLLTTNSNFGLIEVGNSGAGSFTQSNGTVQTVEEDVGESPGGAGTLTVAGGSHVLGATGLFIGDLAGATGAVWVTGGQLTITNSNTSIGVDGIARMTVSNGTWQARNVFVGRFPGSQGTLTVVGGSSSVYSNLILGDFPCTATGTVIIAGGSLFVTNAAGSAKLEVRSGTVEVNSGTLVINNLILTNACARFLHTGGTLVTGLIILSPDLDADGDGLPNGYESTHGLDPLNPADATLDSDGDGLSNLQEYLAGTDATNSLSAFRVTSILRQGNNVRITWTTVGGKTNRVLVATDVPGGGFTNEFSNLSPLFAIPGVGESVTNYLDVGGATNVPSRYYRIRLVP